MLLLFFNVIGLIGVGLVLLAYLLLQMHRLKAADLIYSIMNFFGSGLILISLFYQWNLSAAIVEGAWVIISAYGIGKTLAARKRTEQNQTNLSPK